MKRQTTAARMREYDARLRALAPDGFILQGSVVRRHLVRQTTAGPKRYGPYYLWTRKSSGKTLTVALDQAQAALIRDAIQRERALARRLSDLRTMSERILFALTTGVPRRSRDPDSAN